jgi:hypothetical protein
MEQVELQEASATSSPNASHASTGRPQPRSPWAALRYRSSVPPPGQQHLHPRPWRLRLPYSYAIGRIEARHFGLLHGAGTG